MARGGVRYGAGRPGHKVKAEQTMRVDIRLWSKRGYLHDGHSGTWTWSRGDERVGDISYHVRVGSIRLAYSINGSDASQTVRTTTTPCGYGGSRSWFSCPVCCRRVALLYMRSGRFACRSCQRISYTSQSGSEHDRMINRYHRLNGLVEAGKPKWQRWATFNRLEDRLERADYLATESLIFFVQRLMGRTSRKSA